MLKTMMPFLEIKYMLSLWINGSLSTSKQQSQAHMQNGYVTSYGLAKRIKMVLNHQCKLS